MKGFLITHKGMEDTASLEVKELIEEKSKINEACIVFDIKNYEDLFKLCYKSQSSIGIYYLLHEFNYHRNLKQISRMPKMQGIVEHHNIFTDFKENIEKINLEEWLNKKTQFRVKCIKNYDNDVSTPEIEKKLGEIIIDHIQKKHNYKQQVNLENPEIIVFVYLTDKKCFVGIDFTGFDLSKRSYKIFSHAADIKGTIGYNLIRLSNYKKNETLLDAFSGFGTIPIESTLFASKFPINFFNKEKFIFLEFDKFKNYDFKKLFRKLDKEISSSKLKIYNLDSSMKYLNYAKKNSKIAGVDKKIIFSRMDIEWLDTKFKKGSIDKIITKLPVHSKNPDKIYNEFFYQAEFILSNKGKIILIGNKELITKSSSKYKFKITEQRNVSSGQMKYEVFVLTKREQK